MSISHQNRRLVGGDQRGGAGRIGAEWDGAHGYRITLRRPRLFLVITPILASPWIFLVGPEFKTPFFRLHLRILESRPQIVHLIFWYAPV